jgi:hypothetical protein
MRKNQKMSEEAKEKIRQALKGRRCSMKSEFRKGRTPWNKGLKGVMKANKGCFKKGHKPKNYQGGFKTCKDGIYVKVEDGKPYSYQKDGKQVVVGKYESLARKRYREAFGEFDKNLCVWHKDGEIYNNEIENLELVTRAENIRRNNQNKKANCIICGKEFIRNCGNAKTCSKECYKKNCRNLGKRYAQEHRETIRESQRRYREKIKFKKEFLENGKN